MKRIIPLLCALALLFAACAARSADATEAETTTESMAATTAETTTEAPTETTTITTATTIATTTGYAQNRGWAFYQVFLDMGAQDLQKYNKNLKYIAVDMTGVPKDSQATLERLMREYCAGTGQTLIIATMEELEAQGYVEPYPDDSTYKRFPEGTLYTFSGGGEAAYAGPLTIRAGAWQDSFWGGSATFTVVLNGDVWEVTHVSKPQLN